MDGEVKKEEHGIKRGTDRWEGKTESEKRGHWCKAKRVTNHRFSSVNLIFCIATENVSQIHSRQPVWNRSIVYLNVTLNTFTRKLESVFQGSIHWAVGQVVVIQLDIMLAIIHAFIWRRRRRRHVPSSFVLNPVMDIKPQWEPRVESLGFRHFWEDVMGRYSQKYL